MAADGGNVSQLTDGGTNLEPAWSPDGRLIAFASDRTGNRDLFLMANDGTNEVQLTAVPSFDERPDWQVLPRSEPPPGPQPGDYKNAKRFCKAERRYLGKVVFRQKYGKRRPFRQCVKRNGGRNRPS